MTRKEKLHRELHILFDEVKLIIREDGEESFECKNEVYNEGIVVQYDEWLKEMYFYNKGYYTVLQLHSKLIDYDLNSEEEEEIRLENEIYEVIDRNLSLRKELSNSFYIER